MATPVQFANILPPRIRCAHMKIQFFKQVHEYRLEKLFQNGQDDDSDDHHAPIINTKIRTHLSDGADL